MDYTNMNDDIEQIRHVQNCLYKIGKWTNDPVLEVAVDGVYGEKTQNAVRHFQELCGLPCTGVVDKTTLEAIQSDYKDYEQLYCDSSGIHPFPDKPGFEMEMGERSNLVCILKIMLNELKLFYDCYAYLPLNHRFDRATEEAVKQFQRVSGLPQTGVVNKATWNRLAEEFDLAVKEGCAQ